MDVEELINNDSVSPELYDVRHGFEAGKINLLVGSGVFSELVNTPFVCSIPDTPNWFLGFANHRGDVIPVYDLDRLCDPSAQAVKKPWLLLIGPSPRTVGILVESSPQSVVSPKVIEQSPLHAQSPLAPFLGCQYEARDSFWFEFDHERCFETLKKQF